MGLNDLTIEKLITEINGYKEKMRTIHEEYGRASSDLQDRINVLGYTLNEHLKQTKDQMATTPQRLLNLEMKFVTGDVNESEYRTQRTEFKGLLENNGTGSPTPETTNAPSAPLNALAASTAPVTAPVASSDIASSSTLDESFNLAPSQDVAEDVADALVVKVVDDIPTLDASAQVATSETSQIQPAIHGTEAVPGIQGSPDLSSVGLAPPSQFYKVVCSTYGADVPKPAKVWELKGGKSKKNVLIGLFQCQDCRVKFREALTREIL